MILRRSHERGHVVHHWLDTYHTFSFAHYYDPQWMSFGSLRVINEDRIQGKEGFGEHFHNNMEILTYVLSGELAHHDSLGNGSTIHPNEIQYMSAGTGIMHSEMNPGDATTHLLQIWIEPNVYGEIPRYQDKKLGQAELGTLELLASSDGRSESIVIRQDADIYRGIFAPGTSISLPRHANRIQWIQVISGDLNVNDTTLSTGDACGLQDETDISLTAKSQAHFLLFDLTSNSVRSNI